MRFLAAALLASLLVANGWAQDSAEQAWQQFSGLWVKDLAHCNEDGDHLRYQISLSEINAYEQHCRIVRRSRHGSGFSVQASCSFDDETVSVRFVLERIQGNRIAVTESSGGRSLRNTLQRCVGAVPQTTASGTCVAVDGGQRPIFYGKLSHQIFPGPPNYEDVRRGDRPESTYILQLGQPVCVRADNDPALNAVAIDRIHLVAGDTPNIERQLRALIGTDVAVTGSEGFGAYTAHHRAPLVLQVVSVTPAQGVVADDGAITTVQAFYRALEVGDGATAAQMIVPWKRSGPFSSAQLSRYYGQLSEPLRLIEVVPAGSMQFLARYTFVDRNRRCEGRAIVHVTRSGDLNLIESIRALSGC